MPFRYAPVILTGLPGSGKTTCGALLAERLGRFFVDTDQLIEQALNKRVREIFEAMGEPAFRELESAALSFLNGQTDEVGSGDAISTLKLHICSELERANACDGLVIAVGGGAPESKLNRETMKDLGTVVYLSTPVAEIALRLESDGRRPLLQTDFEHESKLEAITLRLTALLDRRSRCYETADIKIETAGLGPDEIIIRLQEALKTVSKN